VPGRAVAQTYSGPVTVTFDDSYAGVQSDGLGPYKSSPTLTSNINSGSGDLVFAPSYPPSNKGRYLRIDLTSRVQTSCTVNPPSPSYPALSAGPAQPEVVVFGIRSVWPGTPGGPSQLCRAFISPTPWGNVSLNSGYNAPTPCAGYVQVTCTSVSPPTWEVYGGGAGPAAVLQNVSTKKNSPAYVVVAYVNLPFHFTVTAQP
jgi:hypothetical protein